MLFGRSIGKSGTGVHGVIVLKLKKISPREGDFPIILLRGGIDRRGEKWRIFNEINVVNLQYKPVPYTDWQPLPSGLNGSVRLIPVTYK